MPSDESQPVTSRKGADWPGTPITAFDTRMFSARMWSSWMINTQGHRCGCYGEGRQTETRSHSAVSLLIIQRITRVPISTEAPA